MQCAIVTEALNARADKERGMHDLGVSLDTGEGRSAPDHVAAADWYRRAAEKGNAPSASNLCVMYASGRGVKRSKRRSQLWARRAADLGTALVCLDLARDMHTDRPYARKVGFVVGAEEVGHEVFTQGHDVPPAVLASMVHWIRKAALVDPRRVLCVYRDFAIKGPVVCYCTTSGVGSSPITGNAECVRSAGWRVTAARFAGKMTGARVGTRRLAGGAFAGRSKQLCVASI